MREFLIPIFGEAGAVVAQFLLTIIIVLGLIGVVWWFVRRYSGVHFGGIGRGRVPRLAIVDVMPVDRRRRLVLVRRDNVEHLLLIGGPGDVVVEGTIQRVRQRSPQQTAQQAAQAAQAQRAALQPAFEPPPATELEAPPAERAAIERPPVNAPIPFPAVRNTHLQAPAGNGRPLLRSVRPPPVPPSLPEAQPEPPPEPEAVAEPQPAPVASAAFVEPQHPTQLEPIESWPEAETAAPPPPEAPQQPEPQEVAAAGLFPEVMTAEAAPPPTAPAAEPAAPLPATFAEAEREAAAQAGQAALDLGDVEGEVESFAEAPATAAGQEETVTPESTARVSDLEREMARLLDEITTRRST